MTLVQRVTKRGFDLALSLLGLVALIPLMAFLALAVKVSSPGPVLFRQRRVGRYGQPFECLKFRTMRVGADSLGTVTTSTDERVTSIGRQLRRFKLDELPQLWNVLVGEMSLVGPRPDVPGYADELQGNARRMLDLRPGITGDATLAFRDEEELLAQVGDPLKYNDRVLWPKKVALNLDYLDDWSIWRDVQCIVRTLAPPRRGGKNGHRGGEARSDG